jgi:hypothetical protein
MFGLPLSLAVSLWLVFAFWTVALVTYFFDFAGEMVWLVLILGTTTALYRWAAGRSH